MYLKIFGLPAHPLVVHATVVLVPLAALLVAAAALWPALRCGRRCAGASGCYRSAWLPSRSRWFR